MWNRAKARRNCGKCKHNPPEQPLDIALTKSYARGVVIEEVDHLVHALATLQLEKSKKK